MKLTQIGFKSLAQLMWLADLSPAPGSYADFLRYLCVADNEKLKEEFGYQPQYTTKEALLTFIESQRLRKMDLLEGAA